MTEQLTITEKWEKDTIQATTPDGNVVKQPEAPKDEPK